MIVIETPKVKVLSSTDECTYKVVSFVKGVRGRTFKGEFAWADAARYVADRFNVYLSL